MSREELAPFLKWGSCKSQDQHNPDVLEHQVLETETFPTTYSVNVRVLQKLDGKLNEIILPLKSNESTNNALLKEWIKHENNGLVKPGKKFLLKTWLAKSKLGRPIRRFVLEF